MNRSDTAPFWGMYSILFRHDGQNTTRVIARFVEFGTVVMSLRCSMDSDSQDAIVSLASTLLPRARLYRYKSQREEDQNSMQNQESRWLFPRRILDNEQSAL